MTEQQALKYLKDANRNNQMVGILPKSDIGKCLVKALEEVQQYRAIGTVSELQDLVIGINALADRQFSAADMAKLVNDMKSLCEYRQIGASEECRAAVEKQKEIKPKELKNIYPSGQYECPVCGYCVGKHKYFKSTPLGETLANCKMEFNYCPDCGQKLDWSDE